MRPYSKNVSGACRPSLAQCVYEIRSIELLLRKRPITNKEIWRVRNALQNHLETYPRAKYNSTSRVHRVTFKLSEIVGNFPNFIIRTKIASCVDVAAYSDVEWMSL